MVLDLETGFDVFDRGGDERDGLKDIRDGFDGKTKKVEYPSGEDSGYAVARGT